jgi:hypothetical protein
MLNGVDHRIRKCQRDKRAKRRIDDEEGMIRRGGRKYRKRTPSNRALIYDHTNEKR